mgnify:FL=1
MSTTFWLAISQTALAVALLGHLIHHRKEDDRG